jgi:cytochrome c peroxidase
MALSHRFVHRFAGTRGLCFSTLIVGATTERASAEPTPENESTRAIPAAPDSSSCSDVPPEDPIGRGELAFHDRALPGLGGNGRACSDCHTPEHQFSLTPSLVEARFQAMQATGVDDPLFRPIDADDFRANGAAAQDYSNLRENALIRVTFALPANVRLIDPVTNLPSAERFADVWRAVPSVNDVLLSGPDATTPTWIRGPNPAGGFQADARFGTLQEQALAALTDHAQIELAPEQSLLDDLAAFQNAQFSSPGLRSAASTAPIEPLPPDASLTSLQLEGKAVFVRSCMQCHGGPGLSTPLTSAPPFTGNAAMPRYHNVNASCPRPVDTVTPPRFVFPACPASITRNARTYEFTRPDGTVMRRITDDPGRALLSGIDTGSAAQTDLARFDNTSLHGISQTAPYFHNNSAATLDEVLDLYAAFFENVKTVNPMSNILATTTPGVWDRPFTPEERPALLAFLNAL